MTDLLFFNGINGATGDYGLPPMTGEELSAFIQGEARPENLDELRWRHGQKEQRHFGIKEGLDPKDLGQSGWGVIFAHDADPALQEALSPLLKLRHEQAGEHYRLYEKGDGLRVGKDTKGSFLARQGAGPGPADPDRVPYYLLIVGSPQKIPYRFQSQLDVQYAVGRIDFGDDLDAYKNYAKSVVAAETGQVKLSRQVSFFGVANPDDPATSLSADHLASPLVKHLKENQRDWQVNAFLKDQARKDNLKRLLGGDQTPALLFTASHGMEFPMGDGRQIPHQGALLCQDWPGPKAWSGQGAIPQEFYFAGDDLLSNANLLGLMGFFFACYGGGTPRVDEFAKQAFKNTREAIAPYDFLAALPTRMLSNPGGGALAVIGHVERAWGYSFVWDRAGRQTTVFESTLDRLLGGHPIGSAVEYLNERYAELSTVLADQLEEIEYGMQVDPYELAGMWTANNDARGYVVIGDPAARLPVVEAGKKAQARPVLELKALQADAPAPSANTGSRASESQAQASQGTPEAAPAPMDANLAFGLLWGRTQEAGEAGQPGPLQEFMRKLGQFMVQAIDEATTLEVDTYVSDDMEHVKFEAGTYSGANLRAKTRIQADGDTQICVPQDVDGDIDTELWAVHMQAVRQAQESRAQLIKTAIEAGTSLLGIVRPG